ncbi:MAG TPA: sugar phosphate isomerase/epimerase [Verrucomicrobiales bacterium]|nr:sugar phosphate isomerase/epimerase [Verrucomicrobiales bacterium]HIL70709.1 sugar phosphate isomerase/epimerase [Verrucomicrobiota bacterium]
MTIDLACGRIGVEVDVFDTVRLAAQYGFQSIEPSTREIARLSAARLEELKGLMKDHKIEFGASGLPIDFRRGDSAFREGLLEFPELVKGLQRAGITRMGTWLRPSHNELTYLENFKQHSRRLNQAAHICGDHGIRLGLEYVGTFTSRISSRYHFVHSLNETLELIDGIGRDNVGLVLDTWHWWQADETAEDLKGLTNKDIVAVDLNDAPTGREKREQRDNQRELPCSTGVIDISGFMQFLKKANYDGPCRAEPFNAPLRAMPPEKAVAATAAAVKTAFNKAA